MSKATVLEREEVLDSADAALLTLEVSEMRSYEVKAMTVPPCTGCSEMSTDSDGAKPGH